MSEDEGRRGKRGRGRGRARREGKAGQAGQTGRAKGTLVGEPRGGGSGGEGATPPLQRQQRLRHRRLQLPPPQQQLQQQQQEPAQDKQKTVDAFRVKLRSGEHHQPNAASLHAPVAPVLRARHKMVKQRTVPSLTEEAHAEQAIPKTEDRLPIHTAVMTTATTPPPPQRAASEPNQDAVEESAEASTDLGTRPVCTMCDGVVATPLELAAHMRMHHDLGVDHSPSRIGSVDGFACRVCRSVFAAAAVLDRHVLSHPGSRMLTCPLCGVALCTNGGLHRHMRAHTNQFEGGDDGLRDLRGPKRRHNHHQEDEEEVESKRRSPASAEDEDLYSSADTPVPGQRFTCPVCPSAQPFRAPYLHELEAHLEQAHREYSVSCDVCGEAFKSVRVLNLHRYSAHRGKARTRDVVGFKDLTFVDFSAEKFPHIARAECEKSLHRASSRMHPFQCECGRAFPCGSALGIHRQECPLTVYVDNPADLSAQVRRPEVESHSDNTRDDFFAKLDLLNNSTPTSPALSASPGHARQPHAERDLADIQSMLSVNPGLDHAEEEQQDAFAAEFRRMKQRGEFPCRLCPEVFPNLRALKGHNRAHMSAPGADGYRCNMCPHAALDKMALQRHMRTHNGARPYECALCHFAFTTKANCERHLRNRHAKCTREEVKGSIIYHPSEDPGNDVDVKRSLFPEPPEPRDEVLVERQPSPLPPPPPPVAFPVVEPDHRRPSLDVATMTSEDEADRASPLDLSMVLDLSKKRPPSPPPQPESTPEEEEEEDMIVDDEQPQDLSRKSTSESSPQASSAAPVTSTPVAPSAEACPFPALGAQLGPQLGPLYVNPYPLGVQPPALAFPYYGNILRGLQLSAGAGLVLEPLRLLHRQQAFLAGGDASVPTGPPTASPVVPEAKEQESRAPASPKSERSSASDSQAHSKMVMKNGVLMPKQKQRRYRTERPHVCEHCSARFTLSSNRERHVKQQHPQFWSQRHRGPGPLVVRDQASTPTPTASLTPVLSSPQTPAPAPATPTAVATSTPTAEPVTPGPTPDPELKPAHQEDDDEDESLVIDEERTPHPDHVDEGAEGDAEDEGQPAAAPGEDLASVSRLLDNASTQTFRQFFRDGEEGAVQAHEDGSEEDEEGLVAGSPSEGNNSGSDEKSESESTAPQKKKSAYSLAPNRVSCPYCSRKFPWTSSLRRHVLTHTGQKPFKCRHCPLLFTTKSNCDRHLARKHSNKDRKDENTSSSGVSSGTPGHTPNTSTTTVSPGSSASGGSPPDIGSHPSSALSPNSYQMRNVPERPYKCRHCPSSTFSTLSNLRKHVASKHTGMSVESCTVSFDEHNRAASQSGYESHSSISDDPEHLAEDKASDIEAEKKFVPNSPAYDPENEVQPLSLCKSSKSSPEFKIDIKVEPKYEPLSLCKSPDISQLRSDIMKEAHSNLMATSSPVTPITAPVASVPEVSGSRVSDSSISLPSSELPFKCHLCDGSFTERQECLDHIRLNHSSEYEILLSKGALELSVATSPEDNNNAIDDNHNADGENIEQLRGKFPDYANRKVMCAFCMRRFWSAEDLRRHMRTHTGERPFSCDVCRRRFTLKHSMLRHRKKHDLTNNNNNNSISVPHISSQSAEDLSPSAVSGDEEGFSTPINHTSSPADLLMHRVKMTNHNNNNINVSAAVSKMFMAWNENHVNGLNHINNLKRPFRHREEEGGGLIGDLLGIGDPSIIDKVLLAKSRDDAEKLLGVKNNGRT